jgi:hypothetical protein
LVFVAGCVAEDLGPLGIYPFKNLVWRYPFSSACEVSEPKRSSVWSSQTDSNDRQETAPTGKNQVSKVEKLSEESGGRPPVLTIVADDRKLLVDSAILLGRRNTSLVL